MRDNFGNQTRGVFDKVEPTASREGPCGTPTAFWSRRVRQIANFVKK